MKMHLGVYAGWSGSMPACREGGEMPFEFRASNDWRDVTCGRCMRTLAYRQRRKDALFGIIRERMDAVSAGQRFGVDAKPEAPR